jgi:hypothetical protein
VLLFKILQNPLTRKNISIKNKYESMNLNEILKYLFGVLFLTVIIPLLFFLGIMLISGKMDTNIIAGLSVLNIFFFVGSGFLIFIGLMIAPSYPKWGRYLAYGGVVGIMILLLIIETSIVGMSVNKFRNQYESGKIWSECTSTPKSMMSFVSCALTGHQPLPNSTKDVWGIIGVYGFYLAGLLVPLAILTALFADFVESSGVVQNPTYQKIIGLGLGFMAYRGFIVTRLIYILDIGSTGVALIALNFIWLGGILSYINRSFRQWRILEDEQLLGRYSEQALRSLKAIANTWAVATQIRDSFNDSNFMNSLELVMGKINAQAWKARANQGYFRVDEFKSQFLRALEKEAKQ